MPIEESKEVDKDNEIESLRQSLNSFYIAIIKNAHKYIESQIELSKLNNNLSDGTTDYNEEQQRREIRKELIDSIIYIQTLGVGEKEAAYFEYDDGNSEIPKRCISTIKEEYEEQLDHEPCMSVEHLQHVLSEQ